MAALALFITFGLNTLRPHIARAVMDATGRELRIDGPLKPVWSWPHPRVRAEQVRFANPGWAKSRYLFQADAVAEKLGAREEAERKNADPDPAPDPRPGAARL